MHTLALMLLLLQAPGDGWAMVQVPAREVKTLYWELFRTSETWVSIVPLDPTGGPPMVRLIFQAFFDGKETKAAPKQIVLRALPLPMTVVPQYSLKLVVDRETFDLGSRCSTSADSGPPCQLLFPYGEGTAANGVAVEVTPALVDRLAAAEGVSGTALGFPIQLSSVDRLALSIFLDKINVEPAATK